LRSKTSKS